MKKNTILSSIILVMFLISIIAVLPVYAIPAELVADWKFDEGIGSLAVDSSLNTNDGILSGGKFGNALVFDGDADYVDVLDDTSLHLQELTIEAWVNLEPTTESYEIIIRKSIDAVWGSYSLQIISDGRVLFTVQDETHGKWPVWRTVATLTPNQWYHIAGTFKPNTYDASDGKIYIDGVSQTTTFAANGYASGFVIEYTSQGLFIGSRHGANWYAKGVIDEVRISNTAITTFDLTQPSVELTTVALWHFDESVGDTVYDQTLNDNDGQIYGSMWAGPTWTTDESRDCLEFDGVDDYINVPDDDSLDITGEITLEAWIKPDVINTYKSIIVKGDAYTEGKINYGLQIQAEVTDGTLRFFRWSPGYTWVDSTVQVVTGVWQHIVVTVDSGGVVNFYIDGSPAGSGTLGLGPVSDSPLDLARHNHATLGAYQYFDGLIDDVKIWNFAFPDDLVLAFSESSNSIIQVEETANLIAELTSGGSAVAGVTVEFSSSPAGLTIDSSAITDSVGLASVDASTLIGGVYTITATVQTPFGVLTDEWTLVVFDPNGMSAGGGWYITTENDDTVGVTDGARASFGFVAKYVKGSPKGNLEFQYKADGIDLKSTEINWLVVGGTCAQFKGLATIKGSNEEYWFRVQAKDLGEPGVGVDDFNIKIWDGDPDDPETDLVHSSHNTLSGGNIQVKTK